MKTNLYFFIFNGMVLDYLNYYNNFENIYLNSTFFSSISTLLWI